MQLVLCLNVPILICLIFGLYPAGLAFIFRMQVFKVHKKVIERLGERLKNQKMKINAHILLN